jgi:hypothetical protein
VARWRQRPTAPHSATRPPPSTTINGNLGGVWCVMWVGPDWLAARARLPFLLLLGDSDCGSFISEAQNTVWHA